MNTENKYIKYEYINKQGHAKYWLFLEVSEFGS